MSTDYIAIADKLTNVILLSIAILQEISAKSKEEILADITTASDKTDYLLEQLR